MDFNFCSRACCYALMLGVIAYSLIVDATAMPSHYNIRFGSFGGKWKYLTHLNLIFRGSILNGGKAVVFCVYHKLREPNWFFGDHSEVETVWLHLTEEMASSFLPSLAIYTCFALTTMYGIWCSITYPNPGGATAWNYQGFAGKWKFLTFLNAWMQAIYWIVVVLAGFSTFGYEPRKRRGTLHILVDYFHASLAFPVGVFVCVTFWLIYAVDRELVYPKYLDEFIPLWLNHVMHTAHLPFLIIDKYLTRHRYPKQTTGMAILIVFAAAYNSWVLYLALEKNIWVYPILAVMNWTYRIIFFILLWGFFLLLYRTGALITFKFWGRAAVKASSSATKAD